jgi:hypothetical protein
MPFINSPNMGLPIPGIQTEPGPQFASDINQALTILDSHTHSPGSGVSIGAQSINLQSDLSFNVNNATALRSARFISTTATSGTDVGCVYVKGVDLFYNDLNANVIKITSNGGLASTSLTQGLINTTAIISANAPQIPATSGFLRMNNNGDFVAWRNAANSADDIIYFDSSDNLRVIGPGPVAGVGGSGVQAWNFRFPDAGNNGKIITASAPTATSAYTLSLPSQPTSSVAPVFMNPTGSFTTTQQLTRAQLPTITPTSSVSCGTANRVTASYANITNLSVTLTTTGRPVMVLIQGDGTASNGNGISMTGSGTAGDVQITRDGNSITGDIHIESQTIIPGITFLDINVPAGSHTYVAQYRGNGANAISASFLALVAYET